MLTLDKIYHASYVLKEVIRPTDMIKATNLSDDCNIYLKTENLQVTGSLSAIHFSEKNIFPTENAITFVLCLKTAQFKAVSSYAPNCC